MRIGVRHAANQLADLGGDLGPAGAMTLPCPPGPETAPVPGNHGLRLDDQERRAPSRPHAYQAAPEEAVWRSKPRSSRVRARQHLQLMPQRQDLELEGGACPDGASKRQQKGNDD